MRPMKWSTAFINALPDSSFAHIANGVRLFPFCDAAGVVEASQLNEALARLPKSELSDDDKKAALDKLSDAKKKLPKKAAKKMRAYEGGAATLPLFSEATSDQSFEERRSKISDALSKLMTAHYPPSPSDENAVCSWYIVATYDDAVVVRINGDDLFRYPVTFSADGECSLGEPEKVEVVYQALKESRGFILGPLLEEGEGAEAKRGSRWAVVVIREGLSANRAYYSPGTLRTAAQLYEGAKVFWNHVVGGDAGSKPMRDPRDIAGFLREARYAEIDGRGGAITAVLHATSPDLRTRLVEAYEAGNPDLYGLSHAVVADYELAPHTDGRAMRKVTAIRSVESVDVVSFPSAGGRVMRLVAGMASPVPTTEEDLNVMNEKLKLLKERRPDLFAKLVGQFTEAQVDALLLEACGALPLPGATPPAAPPAPPAPVVPPVAAPAATQTGGLSEAERSLLHEAACDRALAGVTLPTPMVAPTRKALLALVGAGSSMDVLREHVMSQVQLAAALTQPPAAGSGLGAPAESGQDAPHKMLEAVEDYFFGNASPAVVAIFEAETKRKPRQGVKSFRRLYEAMTGDRTVSGYIAREQMQEATRFLESLSVASWAQVFGNVLNRRMLAEYRTEVQFSQARLLCSNYGQPLADLTRPQRLIRTGSYADLSTVGEREPYPDLTTPGDEEVTYTPAKRGGLETISREAILADDLNQIRQLPVRIAHAARRTLYKFIMSLFNTNPTLWDSVALAAVGHGNLITNALSASELSNAYVKLATQTDMSGNEVLGLIPKILVVHPALRETGFRLTSPSMTMHPVDGRNATEPNYIRQLGLDTLVLDYYTTDTNNWWVIADPQSCPTIEIGFVNGQEEPELFEQNQPNIGAVFSADVMSWKVRHEYGGGIVDYRGFVGGIVSGS